MTTERRLTRDLPEILGDLAMGPYPDYIDDVLATTATIRQRPAWTFPERWLPMVDLVRQPVFVPRLPLRSIALAIVVLLALLAAAILYVGSQQRVPAPFGLARNGLIAYSAGGDIYTADPVTGTATPIITGPETDRGPRFSLDGTHIAFARFADDGTSQIYVARSDGTGLTLVTPTRVNLATGSAGRAWERYKFSPDGRELLIATASGMTIARTDGSGASQLDVGMLAEEPTYRPPDGNQILFIGRGASTGLFVLDRSTNQTRQIVKMERGFDLAGASWSPDGSKVAYWTWGDTSDGLSAKTHVVNADGTGDRELPSPAGAVWNAHATWSNDGKRLFLAQRLHARRGRCPGLRGPGRRQRCRRSDRSGRIGRDGLLRGMALVAGRFRAPRPAHGARRRRADDHPRCRGRARPDGAVERDRRPDLATTRALNPAQLDPTTAIPSRRPGLGRRRPQGGPTMATQIHSNPAVRRPVRRRGRFLAAIATNGRRLMMSAGIATTQRRGSSARLARRLSGPVGTLVLAVLVTGNVAAYQLNRDDRGSAQLVTPRVNVTTVSGQWMSLKLVTKAGYKILVYG